MRVGIVVPHMFMHRDILPNVIFSPAQLALALVDGLVKEGIQSYLYSPGPVDSEAKNMTADLTLIDKELEQRGYGIVNLLKKHPQTFVSLARQVQTELIAKAYKDANDNKLDIVHIYTNEEEIAMAFAKFCNKPVVFNHHDPFSYLIKYKTIMPKYKDLNWVSFSKAQRAGMPKDTNWVANIYHGLNHDEFKPIKQPNNDYIAFMGRIIEPKGLHLLIKALNIYNQQNNTKLKLKIAGKHYSGHTKDTYWNDRIKSNIDNKTFIYEGFINDKNEIHNFLANAKVLVVPSIFDEPFGMVSIEALANGTPVIGLDSGALPEVIKQGKTGYIAKKENSNGKIDELTTANNIAHHLGKLNSIKRTECRKDYEKRFTTKRMVNEYIKVYESLISN